MVVVHHSVIKLIAQYISPTFNIILVQNQTNLGTFLSQVCCYCVVEARDRLVGLSESGCGASRWDHTHRADVENGTKLRLRGRRREPCFLSLQARRPPPVADARAEVARVRRRWSPSTKPCTAACRSPPPLPTTPPPPSSLCSFLEFLILVLVISECSKGQAVFRMKICQKSNQYFSGA